MGIDQFPSPFKVKPLIKKQKLETPAQSEIHTPSKSKVIENSRTITSIEHDNRQEDVLSWIDDLDSRIKRTLSRQYIESIELKNQTNMEDMREKYRQVPFDDSFRKLSSILKKGNEVDSDQEASYEVAEGKLPTDNEDDEMDFSEDVETNETPELESEGQLDDDIIEIISSEREEAFDSGNISNNYEENEQDEEVTPGLNINALRTQGVTYHIKNGRPRLLDNYMNINDSEQNEKSEYSSEYSNGNDDGIDIDETNGDEDEDEDEHENGNEVEYEGEYEEEHEERRNQDDSDDEIIILDSDEENNNTQINKEKNFDSGSNPASFSFYEDLENGIQDNLSNGVDHDDNEDEDEDEDENEHQEYVYPNNNLENNSSISLVYSNQVELLNENKVIDEKDNLMSLAEAVLKESNDMSDENSFMTARGSDSLYQDDKSGIAQYSTNINSGYTADYDSTDVNYQAANLSGIEEENKEVTDPVAHTHEPFLKEDSVSSDSIQLVDDFENISEGSLADEEQDYEDSSNNDRGFTLNKHKIYEHSGAYEIKEEESNEDNYSIEVEHINEVPIFKTVAEEDPETVLFKLKEAEQKFHIRLNSIKCLEDELILKNGHLPESYIPNQFVEEDQNDISSNKTYGKEVVADFGSIPKPIPKPLLQDLSILDETTILETMNDGDNKEGSISLPVLKQLDDGKTVIDETSIMDDNDNDLQKGFKPEYVSGPILGQIGLDQSDNTPVNDIEESKHEVFQGPNLNPIYYDTPEVKDSTYNVSHDVRQHDTDGDEIDHIRGPLLDQIDDNKSQTNDIIMSRMDEEKECIDVPALEEHDSDQSRIYNTTMNEMEVDMNENISNDVLEHTESSQSNSNDKILEQAEQDEKYINVLSLEQVEADQSRIDDTTMNDSVEENQESISTPALEKIEVDKSTINDTTVNETVEENQESIPTPALEQIEADQSTINDTTVNETVEENQESISTPALEQIEVDQSRIDDTTMNDSVEENQESIPTPALEQIESDQSRIDDITMNETVEENQESIPIPALEQVEADQSRIDDTTMNETLEENDRINVPKLKQIGVEQSGVADTTIIEMNIEQDDNVPNDLLSPDMEQVESHESIIDTPDEMADDNQGLLNSPKSEVIEQSNFGLATDEIQEMKDKLLPEVTESLREKSISEMLYPSITQELDDIHNGHDESKIDIETTIADNEVVNKDIDAKYESYTEKEKNALDQIPINIDKNDIDLNKDVEFDTSDEYENKRSLSSEQIVEEPQEADENIIFEYEQTTYVNVMGDGILHPSYIMEPIEEQQETQLPDYIEQLEIITGTSAIDDMEVLEPSAIIEPSDTETDRAELINSAFEQQFEIIEPTGVLEPPSRSQTPKLSGTHRESINAEEIFEKGSSKGSRKRNRESESFVRSKLRKLIYKPFQWLSKNRKSSPISPTHIEAPKLRPLDDNTANSSLNKNARKPIQKDADIKPDDSVDKNKKKYYELMRHLKRSVDLKSSEVEKNNLNNLVDYEKEEDNSDDHMIDDEDKLDYSAVNENEPSINAPTNVKEKTFEDENLEQSINESHAKNSSFATNSDYNPPFTELEINDSAKNLKSTKQRSTSAKSKRPRKVLGLDMSEAHIEPVRSLRSGHKYGPEENDHQTSDLLASPNKTLRSNKELPKLRINKRRHLSNTKALDNSSPIEIDSKQSLPSSRKSSGSKWVESLLDHPALRTRSKSPLKRSIYQISSDLEEDSNLPRRSSRLRHPNEKLNDEAALENENTEAEEEVKRGRPTKRH